MSTPVACAIALAIAGAVPSSGNSPMPFAPAGPRSYGISSKNTRIGGKIHRSGHHVIGHLRVDHAAFLPHHIFVERETDALRDAAFDLSRCENGIDHLAHFLHRDEIFDANFGGARVHGNFGDVNRPGVSAVGVAAIIFIVPVQIARMFIFDERFQRAVRVNVFCAGLREIRGSMLPPSPSPDFSAPLSSSVFFRASAADSTSLPTIIAVRDATVGPLFGTCAVSG